MWISGFDRHQENERSYRRRTLLGNEHGPRADTSWPDRLWETERWQLVTICAYWPLSDFQILRKADSTSIGTGIRSPMLRREGFVELNCHFGNTILQLFPAMSAMRLMNSSAEYRAPVSAPLSQSYSVLLNLIPSSLNLFPFPIYVGNREAPEGN